GHEYRHPRLRLRPCARPGRGVRPRHPQRAAAGPGRAGGSRARGAPRRPRQPAAPRAVAEGAGRRPGRRSVAGRQPSHGRAGWPGGAVRPAGGGRRRRGDRPAGRSREPGCRAGGRPARHGAPGGRPGAPGRAREPGTPLRRHGEPLRGGRLRRRGPGDDDLDGGAAGQPGRRTAGRLARPGDARAPAGSGPRRRLVLLAAVGRPRHRLAVGPPAGVGRPGPEPLRAAARPARAGRRMGRLCAGRAGDVPAPPGWQHGAGPLPHLLRRVGDRSRAPRRTAAHRPGSRRAPDHALPAGPAAWVPGDPLPGRRSRAVVAGAGRGDRRPAGRPRCRRPGLDGHRTGDRRLEPGGPVRRRRRRTERRGPRLPGRRRPRGSGTAAGGRRCAHRPRPQRPQPRRRRRGSRRERRPGRFPRRRPRPAGGRPM
ncbi:MAG: Glutamate--cysteine ligase, partial [uncultured Blastococcus sp.]